MKTLRLVILLLLAFLPQLAADKDLASVKRICIGSIVQIGPVDGTDFLRMAIRRELTKVGFAWVDTAERADGVLSIAAWSASPTAPAAITAVLRTPDGRSLWEKDLRRPIRALFPAGMVASGVRSSEWDTFQRAEHLARTLRKDVASAAKGR